MSQHQKVILRSAWQAQRNMTLAMPVTIGPPPGLTNEDSREKARAVQRIICHPNKGPCAEARKNDLPHSAKLRQRRFILLEMSMALNQVNCPKEFCVFKVRNAQSKELCAVIAVLSYSIRAGTTAETRTSVILTITFFSTAKGTNRGYHCGRSKGQQS